MNMKKIFTIGESVLDIIFKGNQPVATKAGGSVLNSSVSLGRLGLPVNLISEIGVDDVGTQISNFLSSNGVNTSSSYFFDGGNTALALAFLDKNEDAHYTFYKNYPDLRMHIRLPKVARNDLVLFGSFFALSVEVRKKLYAFLTKARKAGAIIVYDPNFRNPHKKDLSGTMKFIEENIQFSDIIRGSRDDFKMIFKTSNADDTYKKIAGFGEKVMIYTNGPKPVEFRSPHLSLSRNVPQIDPTSTIGAGDNFNAGIIYSLYKLNVDQQEINGMKKQAWNAILDSGITFGAIVCESLDNYISEEFAQKIS